MPKPKPILCTSLIEDYTSVVLVVLPSGIALYTVNDKYMSMLVQQDLPPDVGLLDGSVSHVFGSLLG